MEQFDVHTRVDVYAIKAEFSKYISLLQENPIFSKGIIKTVFFVKTPKEVNEYFKKFIFCVLRKFNKNKD